MSTTLPARITTAFSAISRTTARFVADDDKRDVLHAPDVLQEVEQVALDGNVKAGGRLVRDQDGGLHQKGARYRHPPRLPAADFMRILSMILSGRPSRFRMTSRRSCVAACGSFNTVPTSFISVRMRLRGDNEAAGSWQIGWTMRARCLSAARPCCNGVCQGCGFRQRPVAAGRARHASASSCRIRIRRRCRSMYPAGSKSRRRPTPPSGRSATVHHEPRSHRSWRHQPKAAGAMRRVSERSLSLYGRVAEGAPQGAHLCGLFA